MSDTETSLAQLAVYVLSVAAFVGWGIWQARRERKIGPLCNYEVNGVKCDKLPNDVIHWFDQTNYHPFIPSQYGGDHDE
jgi:hypothetical protein